MTDGGFTISGARFITSLTGNAGFAGKGKPEIAVAGRSNVGKSSFINCVCGNFKLARVSQQPGKTRLINMYDCGSFLLADLPGYGFAKVSKEEKAKWEPMIDSYLRGSDELCMVFSLVDMRHEPTEDDVTMVTFLRSADIPFTVISTKCDKLPKSKRQAASMRICRALGIQPWQLIPFSSQDRTGKDDVIAILANVSHEKAQ